MFALCTEIVYMCMKSLQENENSSLTKKIILKLKWDD